MKNTTLFFDGAFGTYYKKIKDADYPCEFANIKDQETVLRIHKEYIAAGANAIITNTFAANYFLTEDEDELKSIISNGFALAQKAVSGTDVNVFADIGSIDSDNENEAAQYLAITDLFIDCGATNFVFETLSDLEDILPAVTHIREQVQDACILVSFAVSQDGYTKHGRYYKNLVSEAKKHPIDIIGLNCVCGPTHLYHLIKELNLDGVTFSAMPNSGYPMTVGGRTEFRDNPDYFSEKLLDIYKLGVHHLGGCCGTTPDHIRQSVLKINALQSNTSALHKQPKHRETNTMIISPMQEKLLRGEKVIAVELDPPVDTDTDYLLSAAAKAKEAHADVITIADSPLARTRADSIMLASWVKRIVGIDVLPHMTCRDKNHIAIKASLIGACIENVHNVLVITGDPVTQTDRNVSKGVYNFNSHRLISYIESLNQEVFSHAPFFIGGALNINARQFENELDRAKEKVKNGAKILLTQPIYTEQNIKNLSLARQSLDCKILAGILPIASYKNALFLNNEVAGIEIPQKILDSLKDQPSEVVRQISVDYCKGIIRQSLDLCDGYYIMTPLKKIEFVCDIIDYIRSVIH